MPAGEGEALPLHAVPIEGAHPPPAPELLTQASVDAAKPPAGGIVPAALMVPEGHPAASVPEVLEAHMASRTVSGRRRGSGRRVHMGVAARPWLCGGGRWRILPVLAGGDGDQQ